MTEAQKFADAVNRLEQHASGGEKLKLMNSKGTAKAKLMQKLFERYSIGFDAAWFLTPPPRRKQGAAS